MANSDLMFIVISCETSLHYVPLQTLMVLFDQSNFRLNKTGHVVSASELDIVDVTGCLGVAARALSREHGELLFDWLSLAD